MTSKIKVRTAEELKFRLRWTEINPNWIETVSSNGETKLKTFRIPTIARPSVYHEPTSLATLSLTESALNRHNQTEEEVWTGGPFSQFEAINGQNRHGILAYLLQCYNADISNLSVGSHRAMCMYCSRIVTTGFLNLTANTDVEEENYTINHSSKESTAENRGSQYGEIPPRLAISPGLLIEMLSGLYYIMYNGQPSLGMQAVTDIHYRSCYELYADVQLVTNAIRNSLRDSRSGQPEDGPMGISIPRSRSASFFSKSAITNASFRAKKLPDDIAIPDDKDNTHKTLSRIEEEEIAEQSSKKSGKPAKSGKKSDKSRLKENRKDMEQLADHSMVNGDSIDNIQTCVVRSTSKTLVDNIELKRVTNSSDEQLSAKLDEPVQSSPHQSKLRTPNIKTSNSTKDLKSKLEHRGNTREVL
ncbi:hypothetical protein ScPMuIL_016942 [Solemya velum]